MFLFKRKCTLQKNENMIQQLQVYGVMALALRMVLLRWCFLQMILVGISVIALKEKTGKIYPMETAGASLFILVGFLFVGENILGLIGVVLMSLPLLDLLFCFLWLLK